MLFRGHFCVSKLNINTTVTWRYSKLFVTLTKQGENLFLSGGDMITFHVTANLSIIPEKCHHCTL